MPVEHHHDLSQEFPQLSDRIHGLKTSNPDFAELYTQYQNIDKEIYRIEQEIEAHSDEYTEELKKRRLWLKDRLYAMLKTA